MKIKKFLPLQILIFAIALSACQKSAAENEQVKPQTLPSVSPTSTLTPTPTPEENSAIGKIDFKNFAFSETEGYEKFTLKDGEKTFEMGKEDGISLDKMEYSDVTDDGEKEAILTMSIQTGGSSMPNLIYIYTLRNGKPILLWSFITGDRAEGGLKKVYAENGELVVETFGDNKFENDEWEFHFPKNKFTGYCCPSAYTKIHFKWNGKKFAPEGKPELFDYNWKKDTKEN